MSIPTVGRNAKLYYSGAAIGYAKNISVKQSATAVKDYSMDATGPAILEKGNETFAWTCERMWIDNTYLTLILAGTKFDMDFGPKGTPVAIGERWTDCLILSREVKAGLDGAVLENISGEALSVATLTTP